MPFIIIEVKNDQEGLARLYRQILRLGNIRVADLARKMKITRSYLSQLLNGKRPITPDIAARILTTAFEMKGITGNEENKKTTAGS